jgi:hypothetical protein
VGAEDSVDLRSTVSKLSQQRRTRSGCVLLKPISTASDSENDAVILKSASASMASEPAGAASSAANADDSLHAKVAIKQRVRAQTARAHTFQTHLQFQIA